MADYSGDSGYAPALGDQGAYGGGPINPDKPINPLGTPSNTGRDPNHNPGSVGDNPPPDDQNQQAVTDWSSILGIYGMPPDIAAHVGQIFATTPDVNQATILALAYIRGTKLVRRHLSRHR